MRLLAILLSAVALSGCEALAYLAPNMSGYIVRIEADTDWEGSISDAWGSQSISGFSDEGIRVRPPACWVVRKRRYSGLIRAFGTYADYYRGSTTHPRWDDRASTSPYATVRGCM